MKKLVLIGLIGISTLMAAENNSGKKSFMECVNSAETKAEFLKCKENMKSTKDKIPVDQIKVKIMSKIDERIQKLEESKVCVSKATTKEELKKCRPERDHRDRKGSMNRDRMGPPMDEMNERHREVKGYK